MKFMQINEPGQIKKSGCPGLKLIIKSEWPLTTFFLHRSQSRVTCGSWYLTSFLILSFYCLSAALWSGSDYRIFLRLWKIFIGSERVSWSERKTNFHRDFSFQKNSFLHTFDSSLKSLYFSCTLVCPLFLLWLHYITEILGFQLIIWLNITINYCA